MSAATVLLIWNRGARCFQLHAYDNLSCGRLVKETTRVSSLCMCSCVFWVSGQSKLLAGWLHKTTDVCLENEVWKHTCSWPYRIILISPCKWLEYVQQVEQMSVPLFSAPFIACLRAPSIEQLAENSEVRTPENILWCALFWRDDNLCVLFQLG
jgi:hypothetical protein